MRILGVRGENLTSLEAFSVDLDRGPLASAGVFAITGQTGAGKSTLLDAICLALYGRTPRAPGGKGGVPVGREGEIEGMHWISSIDPRGLLRRGAARGWAEVRFIGRDDAMYRARWEVRRAGNQPDGALQSATQLLIDEQQGVPMGGGFKEVKELIEDRIGLSFEQFQRAVLLAQGEFAAFLRSSYNERAQLLENLTGQWIYSRISRLAFEQAKRSKEEADNLERRGQETQQALLSGEVIQEMIARRQSAEEAERSGRRWREAAQAAGTWYRQWDRVERDRAAEEQSAQEQAAQAAGQAAGQGAGGAARLRAMVREAEEAEGFQALLQAWTMAGAGAQAAVEEAERRVQRAAAAAARHRAAVSALASADAAIRKIAEEAPGAEEIEATEALDRQIAALDDRLWHGEAAAARHMEALQRVSALGGQLGDEAARLHAAGGSAHEQARLEGMRLDLAAAEATLEGMYRAFCWQQQHLSTQHQERLKEGARCPLCGAHPSASGGHLQAAEQPALDRLYRAIQVAEAQVDALRKAVVEAEQQAVGVSARVKEIAAERARVGSALEHTRRERARLEAEASEIAATQEAFSVQRAALAGARAGRLGGVGVREAREAASMARRAGEAAALEARLEAVAAAEQAALAEGEQAAATAAAAAAVRAAAAARAALPEGLTCRQTPEQIRSILTQDPGWLRAARERLASISALDVAMARLEESRPQMPREEARALLSQPDSRQALREAVEITAKLEADQQQRDSLSALGPALALGRAERERWGALSALIGSSDGKKFRSFAQGLSLEVLLRHANRSLRLLSPRYRVERAPNPQRRPEDDMNIQVLDLNLGGQVRPISSLSGGELFLVSLAMALGLAALAGERTYVGTIFIDEGFGSLDVQALDVAISALESLAAEDRQVGIVSHVGALTERIGVQVRVARQGSGRSTVRVTER